MKPRNQEPLLFTDASFYLATALLFPIPSAAGLKCPATNMTSHTYTVVPVINVATTTAPRGAAHSKQFFFKKLINLLLHAAE